MSELDPFALGGRQDDAQRGDALCLALFYEWIEAARGYHNAPADEDQAASDRWYEVEDRIGAISGGAIALAIKSFILMRPEFNEIYAPLPYLRWNPDAPPSALQIGILRDAAALVPEIAEFTSPILHEDAALIDADMEIGWAALILARDDKEPQRHDRKDWRQRTNEKRRAALDRIAASNPVTQRGAEIKARHALSRGSPEPQEAT